MPTELPADFLDDTDIALFDARNPGSNGDNYDELLSNLDVKPETDQPKNTPEQPESEKQPETQAESKPQDSPVSPQSWEPAPEPIADWQKIATESRIEAKSEDEFREILTLRRFAQDEFSRDPEAQNLYQLASDQTPAKARISRYVAESIREPYEQLDDPDLLSRVEGKLTDYFDDEGKLTTKGEKLDDHLKSSYADRLNKKVGEWQAKGKQTIESQKLFTKALQAEIEAFDGLDDAQKRSIYQYVRKGELERIVDGVDGEGKPLSPADAAKQMAEAARWANPQSRKILIEQIVKNSGKLTESELLKKYLI